jgi:hypothetical protein
MLEQISWLLLGLNHGVTIGGILFLDLLRKISTITIDKVIRATYSNILHMGFAGLVTHACYCSIFYVFNTFGMLQMIGWSSGINLVGIYSPIEYRLK